jgi:hypothetical protein
MKKSICWSLFFVALLLSASSVIAQRPPTEPCVEAAWTPEVLTFYGDTAKVAEKLESVKANLLDRRVYLLVSETAGRTEAALFERKAGENVSVSRWSADSNIKLAEMLNEKLLANGGKSCAGELTKTVLRTLGGNVDRGDLISAPTTALAAYHQAWQRPNNDYVRVTLFFLC